MFRTFGRERIKNNRNLFLVEISAFKEIFLKSASSSLNCSSLFVTLILSWVEDEREIIREKKKQEKFFFFCSLIGTARGVFFVCCWSLTSVDRRVSKEYQVRNRKEKTEQKISVQEEKINREEEEKFPSGKLWNFSSSSSDLPRSFFNLIFYSLSTVLVHFWNKKKNSGNIKVAEWLNSIWKKR